MFGSLCVALCLVVAIPNALGHYHRVADCPSPYDLVDFGRNLFGCYYRPKQDEIKKVGRSDFCRSLNPIGHPVVIDSVTEFEKLQAYLEETKEKLKDGDVICEHPPKISREDYHELDGTTVYDGFKDGDVLFVEWDYTQKYQWNAYGYLFKAESQLHFVKDGESPKTTLLNTLLLDSDKNLRLCQTRMEEQEVQRESFDMKGIVGEFDVTLKCEEGNKLRWTLFDQKQQKEQSRVETIPKPFSCEDLTQAGVQRQTEKFECHELTNTKDGKNIGTIIREGYEYTYDIKKGEFQAGDSYTFSCKINPEGGGVTYFTRGNGMIRFSAEYGAVTLAKIEFYDEAASYGPERDTEEYEQLVHFQPQEWRLGPSTHFNITMECSDGKGLLYRIEDQEQGVVHAFPYLPLQAEKCQDLRMVGMEQIYSGRNENPTYHLLRQSPVNAKC